MSKRKRSGCFRETPSLRHLFKYLLDPTIAITTLDTSDGKDIWKTREELQLPAGKE